MRRWVLVAVVVCVACGSAATERRPGEREWTENAQGVIGQLRADVVIAGDRDRLADARRTLHDESELYAALLAYTDFGGCRHMVGALGVPPERLRRAERLLGRACARLQRASALFTRGVATSDAAALVEAARTALRAAQYLDRAQLAL